MTRTQVCKITDLQNRSLCLFLFLTVVVVVNSPDEVDGGGGCWWKLERERELR
ncbi:hypothetical protein Hanom_Chr03g00211791 [Helianthus anomalus]